MADKPTILAVTDKRSIFGILCAILIKDFDVSCTDGFGLNPQSRNVSEAKCVIVDLDISRTDPVVLIEELVRIHPSLRIVALATANSKHLAEQAKIAGARDVLSVPDEIDRLPSVVHAKLD
jgi:DNA-binding NtrC family response regulator